MIHKNIYVVSKKSFCAFCAFLLASIVAFFITEAAFQKTLFFYFLIMSCSLFFMFLSEQTNNKMLFWLSIFIAGMIMAFRAQTGYDDFVYRGLFDRAGTEGFMQYMISESEEKGFLFFNYICYRLVQGDYNKYQIMVTFASFYLWGKAIDKFRNVASLTFILLFVWTHYYFIIMSAALVRLFIALPIILMAVYELMQGRIRKFCILIVCASLFHLAALAMLVLLGTQIKKELFLKYWKTFVFGLIVALPIAFLIIARVLVPLMGIKYLGYSMIGKLRVNIGNFDVFPICMIGIYLLKNTKEEDRKLLTLAVILCFMSMLFSIYDSLVPLGRLSFLGNLGIAIIAGKSFGVKNHEDSMTVGFAIPALMAMYAVLYMMKSALFNPANMDYLFPYTSIWGSI